MLARVAMGTISDVLTAEVKAEVSLSSGIMQNWVQGFLTPLSGRVLGFGSWDWDQVPC